MKWMFVLSFICSSQIPNTIEYRNGDLAFLHSEEMHLVRIIEDLRCTVKKIVYTPEKLEGKP